MAQDEFVRQRMEKRAALEQLGIEPHGRAFARQAISAVTEGAVGVRVAGRIMAYRGHGKTAFLDLADWSGKVQIYFKKDLFPETSWKIFELADIGDIVGVAGDVFRTRTGELTIQVKEFSILSKSLRPLPEKWHGLTDTEARFRHRYVDLIINRDTRDIFRKRIQMLQGIREFLDARGFLEVETPMMHPIAGGAEARPFITHHNTLDADLYLRVAPELYLKRLLVGGFERVYEINRSFRNEGISHLHNPEFTMLELYQAYGDYRVMMQITEELITLLVNRICGGATLTYQGTVIDFNPPWKQVGWTESFRALGIDRWNDLALVKSKVAEFGVEIPAGEENDLFALLDHIFKRKVQPGLVRPTFLTGFPREISPLAKSFPGDPTMTERFELYVAGMEIANAYSELNDPVEQQKRFEEEAATGKPDRPREVDTDYVAALEYGMPPAGGLGIGIDRLTMILADVTSIREVVLFPLLRKKA